MANRWAPWIEAKVFGPPAAQTITGTTWTDVTNVTSTVTCKVPTRLQIHVTVSYVGTSVAPGDLEVRVDVAGALSPIGPVTLTKDEKQVLHFAVTADVAADTATVIHVEAKGSGAAKSIDFAADKSFMTIVGLPSEGVSY